MNFIHSKKPHHKFNFHFERGFQDITCILPITSWIDCAITDAMSYEFLLKTLESFKEPTQQLTLAIPVEPDEAPSDPRQFYGKNWKTQVPMACGCCTYAGLIGAFERAIQKKYNYIDGAPQPQHDFLLTLVCGKCGKQISKPFSAWNICTFHGVANWVAQNSTETFT